MDDDKILIFLDFDGVTHPISGSPMQLRRCMDALKIALNSFQLEVVVSSSWREINTLDELKNILSLLNVKIQGVTPIINEPFIKYVRYHEVLKYLQDTNQNFRRWIAIDDTKGFYPEDAPVYCTNPKTGFVEDDIPKFQTMVFNEIIKKALKDGDYIDYEF